MLRLPLFSEKMNEQTKEEWKAIRGYEGTYFVSNHGLIFSMNTGKVLKERLKKGRPVVTLYRRGAARHVFIHRLLAEAFLPNPDNERKSQVNHKDGNRANNNIDNLEWMTAEANRHHARENNLTKRGNKHPNWSGGVNMYDQNGKFLKTFILFKDACRWVEKNTQTLKAHVSPISECCRGLKLTAYGFKWRYARKGVL